MNSDARPILALAGDPGGANALAPVIALLRKDTSRSVLACAYRQAFDLWRERGLDPQPQEVWQQRLPALVAGAALLLTATSVNGIDLERTAIALARHADVPSLTVLDYWSNYTQRFTDSDREGALVLPDRIAVMDELARQDMLAVGFPDATLVVTGQPAFDALPGARVAFTPQRRADLRRELGVGKDQLLALYVSQPFADIHGSRDAAKAALGYTEDEVLALCRHALATLARKRNFDCVLAIRPHPREPDEKFSETQETGLRTVIWRMADRLEAVLAADLVLGMNSVLLYEAACMGCAVVSVQPGLRGDDPLQSNRSGASLAVYDTEGLGNALEKALFDENKRKLRLVGLGKEAIAPMASERVVQEIDKLLNTTHH